MMQIALSRLHFPITALGPGQRIGLWFQGCSIQCPGCISRDTWEPHLGLTSIEPVLNALRAWHSEADGLTITGGEPFDQAPALERLLQGWREFSDTSVLLFTGYEFAHVAPWLEQRPGLVDAVVAGPFQPAAGQTLALRGSDNQTLHVLTDRGIQFAAYNRALAPGDQHLDVMFDDTGNAWFAGIPPMDMMSHLRQQLRDNGHHAVTSDQKAIAEQLTITE